MSTRAHVANATLGRKQSPARRGESGAGSSRPLWSLANVPLPIAIFLVAALLPPEFDFYLGPLRLNCQRLVLLVFAPVAIARIMSGRGPTLRSFDYLLLGAFSYYALTMFFKEPFEQALQTGGILILETIGTYFFARAYIRNAIQFTGTVKLLFLLVIVAGALAIPELLLHVPIARRVAAAISGAPPLVGVEETRFGLLRATSVFDHPILYGAFCAGVFGLVWFAEPDPFKRLFRASVVAGAAFFSLSSGPLLGILVVLAGIVWERVTRHLPNRVWITITVVGVLYMLASLFTTRSPFKAFITNVVIDPSTAWYRILIWDVGVDNVLRHPWIGLPLGFWERPAWMPSDTVDNYWLATALWGGLPSLVLLVLSILALLRAVHIRAVSAAHPELRRYRYGWTATVLSLCIVGGTVHYWGTLGVLFVFYLGLGAWLTEPPRYAPMETGGRGPALGRPAAVKRGRP